MATVNNLISYANLNHNSWHDNGMGVSNTNGYAYVSAPSFVFCLNVSSVLFRTGKIRGTFYYYDRTTNSWVHRGAKELSQKNAGSQGWKFYHNRGAEGTSNSEVVDNGNFHLWKVHITGDHPGSASFNFSVYTGGVGMMTETQYNSFAKNRKIMSSGKMSNSNLWWWSTSENDSGAFENFIDQDVGTKIFAQYETKLMPKWE